MELKKDIGIILKNQKYKETSIIIRVFLKKHGLKSFLLKGATRKHSFSSLSYNPLSLIQLSWKPKIERKLIIPYSVECLSPLGFNLKTYHTSTVAQELTLLVYRTWKSGFPEQKLLIYLIRAVRLLQGKSAAYSLWIYTWFVLRLLDLHGFHLNLFFCQGCGKALHEQDVWFPKLAEGFMGKCCLNKEEQNLAIFIPDKTRQNLINLEITGKVFVQEAPVDSIRKLVFTLLEKHFPLLVNQRLCTRKKWYELLVSE